MAKSRRGQGEGCIRKRNDGRWVAILDLGYEVGKRKSKSFYGDSEAEVSAKLLEARSNYSKGLPVATGPQTVGQYLDHWLENTLRPNAKPRSYESFSAITRLHIKPNLGNIQLLKLAPQHIQKLLGDKTNAGLSAQTVTNIRTVLRSALTQAMKWGLVSRNVAALVDAPRIPHKDIKPLGPDDARALLAAARGSRYELAYILGLNLGLRRGEILGLRWSDINLRKRIASGFSINAASQDRLGCTGPQVGASCLGDKIGRKPSHHYAARVGSEGDQGASRTSVGRPTCRRFTMARGRPCFHERNRQAARTGSPSSRIQETAVGRESAVDAPIPRFETQCRLAVARSGRPCPRDHGVTRP